MADDKLQKSRFNNNYLVNEIIMFQGDVGKNLENVQTYKFHQFFF